ncbi:YdaS family helix-turn-helix protein [Neisseria elongata]|jgi:hypothetical protein|uniref:YdaS family helix-turn-helix protein n=1 Tax=Neisseria elongata TaxID=495 RepID=UPI00195D86B8|nr:hypothetical protein [Neisseria elongata]MBM7064296.1 hypothetical protein [Neisseria elongata]DAN64032.1 MAG TPA: putative antitoxin of bacterial toxin-antitoxin system, YdaS/YdaT [Caudoviricetes sp.]
MEDKKIIELHGGSTALSKLIGASPQRVHNWKKRGIPAKIKLKYPHLFLNQKVDTRDLA